MTCTVCPGCSKPYEAPAITLAELLIDLAEVVLYPKDEFICATLIEPKPGYEVMDGERMCNRVKLALDFYRRRDRLMIRAVMEEWNLETIVKELY